MNQDNALKFVKILFTIIFTFLYFIFLNLSIILVILRLSLNGDLVKEIILSETKSYHTNLVDDKTLAYIEPSNSNYNKEMNDSINEYLNETDVSSEDYDKLEQEINQILKDNNLPNNIFDYIEDNEENLEILSDIASDYINYYVGVTEEVEFPKEQVNTLLDNAITNYENTTGKKIDRTNIDKMVDDIETEYLEYMDDIEIFHYRDIIYSILNGKIFYTIITLTIVFLIAIILINLKSIKTILTISIPHLIIGFTYFIVGKSLENILSSEVDIKTLTSTISNVGLFVGVVGIVGIIIYFILNINKEKQS